MREAMQFWTLPGLSRLNANTGYVWERDFSFPIREFPDRSAYTRDRDTLISPEEIQKCQMKSGSKHLKTAEK